MTETFRGAGVLFYDKANLRVLLYRRDNNPNIAFPNHLDILGGHAEHGETPEQTVVREISEELDDRRTGRPYVLRGHDLFATYTGPRGGLADYIFCKEADFEITDIRLKEGEELIWITEDELRDTAIAFGYEAVLARFFEALRAGAF